MSKMHLQYVNTFTVCLLIVNSLTIICSIKVKKFLLFLEKCYKVCFNIDIKSIFFTKMGI